MMSAKREFGSAKRQVRFDLVPKVVSTTPLDITHSQFRGMVFKPVDSLPMLCSSETSSEIITVSPKKKLLYEDLVLEPVDSLPMLYANDTKSLL